MDFNVAHLVDHPNLHVFFFRKCYLIFYRTNFCSFAWVPIQFQCGFFFHPTDFWGFQMWYKGVVVHNSNLHLFLDANIYRLDVKTKMLFILLSFCRVPTEFIWLDKMGLMPKGCLFSIYISTRFDVILVFLEIKRVKESQKGPTPEMIRQVWRYLRG